MCSSAPPALAGLQSAAQTISVLADPAATASFAASNAVVPDVVESVKSAERTSERKLRALVAILASSLSR